MTTFTPRVEAPTIRAADIAYLRFARRDLARAERYFIDFGLKLSARTENAIYFRGALPSTQPTTRGGSTRCTSRAYTTWRR